MKKWEYLTKAFLAPETLQDDELNELGSKGWELVAVEFYEESNRFFFKREIK